MPQRGAGIAHSKLRRRGAADNLEEVEIVTANGEIRVVEREPEPKVFWAIRGGSGNFGVVTRFTFRLHEVRAWLRLLSRAVTRA